MPFVLDASIALSWHFEDEESDAAEAAFDRLVLDAAIVPSLWPVEFGNGLLAAERRGRIGVAAVSRAIELTFQLPIRVEPAASGLTLGTVLVLAREYGLSAYDAAYLELALRERLPLATIDARLRAAATRAEVELL